jgi:hypothetical protein
VKQSLLSAILVQGIFVITLNYTVYEKGSPACGVFSKHYKGLCSTDQTNANFKAPCGFPEYKERFGTLCIEDSLFMQAYGIHGTKSNVITIDWFKIHRSVNLFLQERAARRG